MMIGTSENFRTHCRTSSPPPGEFATMNLIGFVGYVPLFAQATTGYVRLTRLLVRRAVVTVALELALDQAG